MICPNCREAGREMTAGNTERARHYHLDCVDIRRLDYIPSKGLLAIEFLGGQWCDCQHDTAFSVVNRDLTMSMALG